MKSDFKMSHALERSALPTEIEKIFAEDGPPQTCSDHPAPELIRQHGRYYVTSTGEIILVSEPCELNFETTQALNEFCRVHRWTYDVWPAPFPPTPRRPLTVLFKTRFFVSPA